MALYTMLYTHEVGGQGLSQLQVLVLVCVGNRESAYINLPVMTVIVGHQRAITPNTA